MKHLRRMFLAALLLAPVGVFSAAPAFAREGRDYLNSITSPDELGYAGCITRNEGPWMSGSVFLSAVSLDGSVLFNAADMSTGGRPLNPLVHGAINP